MSGIPLIIGQAQRAALAALREKAIASPVNVLEMQTLATDAVREKMNLLSIDIPLAYTVTFSIDIGHPVGTCRHMSIASGRPRKTPTPEAVWMVAEVLGFVGGLSHCRVWAEPISDDRIAVNAVQPLAIAEPWGKPQ